MNKEEFNALEILEQVEYINKGLELESVTKVCASIGIDRATVRKRFKRKGYELIDNKYIPTENRPTTTNTIENTTDKPIKKANKKATEQTQDNKQIKVLENRIGSLEKELESIKAILTTITTSTTTTVNTNTTKAIKKYEGDGVSRSYRVNEEVQKQWKVFCKSHSEHRVSDLISNALEEYMNSFK